MLANSSVVDNQGRETRAAMERDVKTKLQHCKLLATEKWTHPETFLFDQVEKLDLWSMSDARCQPMIWLPVASPHHQQARPFPVRRQPLQVGKGNPSAHIYHFLLGATLPFQEVPNYSTTDGMGDSLFPAVSN